MLKSKQYPFGIYRDSIKWREGDCERFNCCCFRWYRIVSTLINSLSGCFIGFWVWAYFKVGPSNMDGIEDMDGIEGLC